MAINYKIILIVTITVIFLSVILLQYIINISVEKNDSKYSQKFFNFNIETDNTNLINLEIDSIFKISGVKDEYIIDGPFQNMVDFFLNLMRKITLSIMN